MWSAMSSIQSLSVVLLVLQNTSLVILMRYSRLSQHHQLYATTSVVFSMEVVKFLSCLLLLLVEKRGDLRAFVSELYEELCLKPLELLKVAIPAILFTIQTNLLYFAISRLDVVTFQATSQLKILTTAFFSVTMLKKTLSAWQWLACGLLCVGVTLTQLSNLKRKTVASSPTASPSETLAANTEAIMGMMAVLFASVTSGFSSVYFEKILKNSNSSLWIRNIQMSLFSILFASVAMLVSSDWPLILERGTLFHGYNTIVIVMIALQALGGLVVAVVMKYSDNIVKGFAASVSIGFSWLFCATVFEYNFSLRGMAGMVLIMVAVSLYSMNPPPPPNTPLSPTASSNSALPPFSSLSSSSSSLALQKLERA